MSDPVVKSAKRLASRPASYSATTKTTTKSNKLTAKSARPKPDLKKKAAAAKPPVRKAAPAKKETESKSGKSARGAKAAPAKRTAPTVRLASKAAPRVATSSASKKKGAAPPVKSQASKAATTPSAKKAGAKTGVAKPIKTSVPVKTAPRPAPPPPRQPTRDEAAALKAFERAHKEFTRGRFGEARNLFRALIAQHSGVAEVTARARTYLAIAEARLRSESSLPRDAESLYDRGVIELNRGDYVAAQEMFERALRREPEAADVHYALAATRARLGAVEPALQSLERALELKPSLRVRVSHDQDLALLRNEPEYERLLYTAPRV